jgi:pimeloyl-ACP methyl ester carboxylesterase
MKPAREPAAVKKTFVLVHGAWSGGWCYSDVARQLRSRGHEVFSPTLTGVGERSHLARLFPISFDIHVQDVVNVLLWEELRDVVLCGHSYGGAVITGVADALPERIAALIYVDAIIPEAGKSVLDINQSEAVVTGVLKSAAAAGGLLASPLPAALLATAPENTERVDRLSTPHPLASLCSPVALSGAWRKVKRRIYIRATGWAGYQSLGFRSYDVVKAEEGWELVDVPCGHEVMLDAGGTLADILGNVL